MATSAPSVAICNAVARPIPREPPVTKATRFVNSPVIVNCPLWVLSPLPLGRGLGRGDDESPTFLLSKLFILHNRPIDEARLAQALAPST